MGLDLKLNLKLGQQLLMTPQLQQAIKLLQLSRIELEEFVSEQLAENPILEESTFESSAENIERDKSKEANEQDVITKDMNSQAEALGKTEKAPDVDWESYSNSKDNAAPIPSSMARKNADEHPNYENMVSKAKNLSDHLQTQISEIDFSESEKKIAESVIYNLDEKGYLKSPVEELAKSLSESTDAIEDVLDTLQRLDPPGVCARDLSECLRIQLRTFRLKTPVRLKIVDNYLAELETRNYPKIAKDLGISVDEVIENVQIICDLEPVPARQYSFDAPQYIAPDVYIFQLGEKWTVSMNEEGIPKLQVSNMYQRMAEKKNTKADDKGYINEKVKSAIWLIKSIQQRQKTIFKVAESILERQMDFFERGMEHLKPMILRDVAEDIEMHESTVSRVTTNKYVHTPRGIFELKFFFNSSVSRSDGGENVASESVKRMISTLIKDENTKKPYSDQKIADLLEEKGISLARRTVAKYREQLGLQPSSKRKRYF